VRCMRCLDVLLLQQKQIYAVKKRRYTIVSYMKNYLALI
jgi:hypothetical protein